MFTYIETDSVLHRRNPMIKLAVIAVMTILVCLSYFPVFPVVTFLMSFFTIWLAGNIPLANLMRRLLIFLVISFFFMLSMLILRGLNDEAGIVLHLGILRWTQRDLVHAITLGFRILALVTMSMGFVLTTRPRDLVLSLILQCRVSVVHGYAAMATYRFLPELQQQVDAVHLAQEIRGIPWNKGILSRFTSPFRVALPLFCVAARRGERIACAMESRGLGRENERTFYKRVKVDRGDWIFFFSALIIYVLTAIILFKLDLFGFSFASIQ
ncbi:energy-coupling factor transporter transmembrane component T family protein [Lachnoclostridium sp. An118]|uniref:energy-coupling factor transporter transmembrane component T family protein n=1 Tax=Lachnoclostridium sp. An118 TaxID=1965547 RepID=UPI000B36F93F|nr:energy-coupling factor transporter transmembrane component T [Lachnoclostridium sp. An118]OUQ48282.1 cobalt ABC transporter permease [Lachnoclostridium sp. An118]